MSASTDTKKQCATCNKNGGILICDGCQQIFCGKHVSEHRQNLAEQLDSIMQEHDLLQHETEQISIDHSSLRKIDQWEKESVQKIRLTAETARKNLQEKLNQSKQRLSKICHDMAVDIRSSRVADDYSENDFIRWSEQLKTLELEITSSSLINIIEDKKSIIHLIKIESNESNNNESLSNNKQPSLSTSSSNLKIQEKFTDVIGPVIFENKGYLAKHIGSDSTYALISGNLAYYSGCRTTRFKLEKCHGPYSIFFGCTSYQTTLNDLLTSPDTIGWFGWTEVYENGRCSNNCKKYDHNAYLTKTNDLLRITFDCDKKQIELFNERLKTTRTLNVDTNKIPYPWKLLMTMSNGGDCVRILTDI
jgi:hypothetical protein